VVNDVVYCTIQTEPSGVIASMPVQQTVFDAGQAGVELGNFADAIEQIMVNAHVNAATGSQTIDESGLLQDFVTFVVDFEPPGTTGTSVTADADVPVTMLNFTDAEIGRASLDNVNAILNQVYGNLRIASEG
jgi:hypothetical protein